MRRSYGAARGFVKRWLSCCVPRSSLLLASAAACRTACRRRAFPLYRPINPVAASRSGLYVRAVPSRPIRAAGAPMWRSTTPARSSTTSCRRRRYVLDSELLRMRAAVSRDLSADDLRPGRGRGAGAYAGFLDGFLEWYHGLLGIGIPERERRPRERFPLLDRSDPDGPAAAGAPDLFLGDVRRRRRAACCPRCRASSPSPLPTSTGPEGYGRGVVSASLLNTARLP